MKVYLAARFSRRDELLRYSNDLAALGIRVVSRWLLGDHQISDAQLLKAKMLPNVPDDELADTLESPEPDMRTLAIRFASEDYDDIEDADLIISFTEDQRSTFSRGGRHVEFGIALEMGTPCWIVGPPENVFHVLADKHFATWKLACAELRNLADNHSSRKEVNRMITQEQRDQATELAGKLRDEGRTEDADLVLALLNATANSGYDDSAKVAEQPATT